jgi:dihydrofolate reductase
VRKVIAYEYITLDGVMESPEKWQFPYFSDDFAEFNKAQILSFDASLLGRVTYEIFASYWPLQTNNEFGLADKINSAPKFVVSSTLENVEWNNSKLIRDPKHVDEGIGKLKQQAGGNIGIIGSATLVQSLMGADLIDEYWLLVHPVVLGGGKRLFKDGIDSTTLKLSETKTFDSGVVLLRYEPDRRMRM